MDPRNRSRVNENPYPPKLRGAPHYEMYQTYSRADHPQAQIGRTADCPGQDCPDVCRVIEVTHPTYHRWRQQYGRKQIEESRRLTQLEKDIGLLTKFLAVAELEKALLNNLAEGNFRVRNAAAGPSLTCRNFTGHSTYGLPSGGPTPPYPTRWRRPNSATAYRRLRLNTFAWASA